MVQRKATREEIADKIRKLSNELQLVREDLAVIDRLKLAGEVSGACIILDELERYLRYD